jgi:hypothetical protein
MLLLLLVLFLLDVIQEYKVECMLYCKAIKYYIDSYQIRQ